MRSNFGKLYNDMKNHELAKDLQDFLDDRYAETDENKDRLVALLRVIVSRLKVLEDKTSSFHAKKFRKQFVPKKPFAKREVAEEKKKEEA